MTPPLIPPTLVNLRSGAKYDLYIGLGTPYGNIYSQGNPRKRALELFEREWRNRLLMVQYAGYYLDLLRALSGKVLGCHCSPKPCHGNILIKLFLEFITVSLSLNDKGTTSGEVGS
jgi:hypothetical protein